MDGQLTIFDYLKTIPDMEWGGCGKCICRNCLYWWSQRCPYGSCFDDKRAADDPYDKAHPDEPLRTGWSSWKEGQVYWCRGGICYPAYRCGCFEKYKGQKSEACIRCNTSVFQDGYRDCPLAVNPGCGVCYEYLMQEMDREDG